MRPNSNLTPCRLVVSRGFQSQPANAKFAGSVCPFFCAWKRSYDIPAACRSAKLPSQDQRICTAAQVVRVLAIAAFEGNTFFARLHLEAAGGAELELDARPSDAINLAARTGAPLFVRRDVAGRVARHQ